MRKIVRHHIWQCVTIFIFLLPFCVHAQSARLSQIQVSNTSQSARMIFTLSHDENCKVFTLENPTRLVIDFEDTRLAASLHSLVVTGVKSIRAGHPKPTTLRLVFDLDEPLKFKQFFVDKKNQLVLDLYLASAKSFQPEPKSVVQSEVQPQATVAVEKNKIPVMQSEQRTQSVTIVIDPGHGGKDTGAIGERGIEEKNVVLGISKKLAELINQEPNMRAVLTRDKDYFVPLRDRLKLARKGKADLFVAVHADAFFNNSASGASVYALSRRGATSEAARWIAKRDNYSELGGVDLGELGDQSYMLRSVLIDLAQTATITDSLRLGSSILDSLEDITRLHYSRVEQAPFVVLKSPDIPSVLVETGFISNSNEELRLNDRNYQAQIALALFNGIHAYLKKYPPGI